MDARNPLRFRCEDVESYVNDIEGLEGESGTAIPGFQRKNLLLINKADLLTREQRLVCDLYYLIYFDVRFRLQWADYFDQQRITYAFFSAANATALQQARREAEAAEKAAPEESLDDEEDSEEEEEEEDVPTKQDSTIHDPPDSESSSEDEEDFSIYFSAEEEEDEDERTKVLTVAELENLFLKTAPKLPRSCALSPLRLRT